LASRQDCEQYLTCSQFLAHDLRHVMTRSQRSHSLLGKFDLFPLKVVFMVKPKAHGHAL